MANRVVCYMIKIGIENNQSVNPVDFFMPYQLSSFSYNYDMFAIKFYYLYRDSLFNQSCFIRTPSNQSNKLIPTLLIPHYKRSDVYRCWGQWHPIDINADPMTLQQICTYFPTFIFIHEYLLFHPRVSLLNLVPQK